MTAEVDIYVGQSCRQRRSVGLAGNRFIQPGHRNIELAYHHDVADRVATGLQIEPLLRFQAAFDRESEMEAISDDLALDRTRRIRKRSGPPIRPVTAETPAPLLCWPLAVADRLIEDQRAIGAYSSVPFHEHVLRSVKGDLEDGLALGCACEKYGRVESRRPLLRKMPARNTAVAAQQQDDRRQRSRAPGPKLVVDRSVRAICHVGLEFIAVIDIWGVSIADQSRVGRDGTGVRKMDLDDQFRRYFGTADLAQVPPAAVSAGIEHMAVDFGMEQDPARRFALWTMMHMLGAAPALDVAFKNEKDRDSARKFMDLIAGTDKNDENCGIGD